MLWRRAVLFMVNHETRAKSRRPLDYELRVSRRAKRVTLRVLPGRGLVVTIPSRFARRDVPALVEKNRQWALDSIAEFESKIPLAHRQWPPQTLHLNALGRSVGIEFESEPRPRGIDNGDSGRDSRKASGRAHARWHSSSRILINGSADERQAIAAAIASCLKQEAQAVLLSQLAYLSTKHGLKYRKAVIRGQRSIWGSYSSTGTLSLNYKLLFLPPELVEYVILHELSHTRHLDHSNAFWALLETLVPGARGLDRQLSRASVEVPSWLEAKG